MTVRMILAAGTLGTLLCSPAFAEDDGMSTSAAAPKVSAQAQVELLPLGTGTGSLGGLSTSTDMAVAYGISGTFEYALARYVSIGVAPRLVFNVVADPEDGDSADKELDLRARIRGHYPVSPGLELSASLSPGYTIVLSSQDGIDSAKGFAIGGAAGVTYDLSPKMFIGAEVGYQRAFTSVETMVAGTPISVDLELSYMHLGIGAGTRF